MADTVAVLRLALGQLRLRPASFLGLAAALLLAEAAVTLFGSLIAAQASAPSGARAAAGPGLVLIAGAFGEIAVLVSLVTVVNALGFTVRQQYRELALLRTVAATPRQARRLVRRQVAAVVLAVTPAGWVLGRVGARWFLAELTVRGMAPAGLAVPGTPLPLLVALAVALLVSLAATEVAVRRISRIAPAAALAESGDEGPRTGPLRMVAGLAALAGGAALVRLAATAAPDKSGQAALLAALVLLVAVGLLGPLAAGPVTALPGLPVRLLARRAGWLAEANLRGYAHRLSAAVVPIALLTGLAGTMVLMTTTVERLTAAALPPGSGLATVTSETDSWLRQAEFTMLAGFAAVATVNTLVALTADRRREFALLVLVGATRRQLARMLGAEALLTAVAGVLLGAVVAFTAAGAFSLPLTGSVVPAVPWGTFGWIVAGAGVLTLPSVLGTGLLVSAGPAVAAVGGRRG
ncbi:FtsX-like permease family protein [Kitasatospora sp. NPDC051853]|uniref:FtsX-like permease family protein n=1 Tax=Kitasatospora sp. NPDC051853 TaxID=3364058 RepID=UPI0037ACF867